MAREMLNYLLWDFKSFTKRSGSMNAFRVISLLSLLLIAIQPAEPQLITKRPDDPIKCEGALDQLTGLLKRQGWKVVSSHLDPHTVNGLLVENELLDGVKLNEKV